MHETRGKTRNAPRPIDLDPTTVGMLRAWRSWQHAEQPAVGIDGDGWLFTDADGQPVHPHAISQAFERLARRACVPVIRLHDVRHPHATLLIRSGVPAKVVSERLGHATAAFTIEDLPTRHAWHAGRCRHRHRGAAHAGVASASTGRHFYRLGRLKNRKKTD